MVSGTPTIYIDGEWDKMRDGYKKLIKYLYSVAILDHVTVINSN